MTENKKYRKIACESGSLMIEAIAMLGLMSMVSPMLFRQTQERQTELSDITVATQTRQLSNSLDEFIMENYVPLLEYLTDHAVDNKVTVPFSGCVKDEANPTEFVEVPEGDAVDPSWICLRDYLPPGVDIFNNAGNGIVDEYRVTFRRDAQNKITGIVAGRSDTPIPRMRASRIASMIGAQGGYSRNAAEISGSQGTWELEVNDYFDGSWNPGESAVFATTSYGSSAASGGVAGGDFLYRTPQGNTQLNTMFTTLRMGNNNIEGTTGTIEYDDGAGNFFRLDNTGATSLDASGAIKTTDMVEGQAVHATVGMWADDFINSNNVITSTNNITTTNGDVISTVGNISAQAGNVMAGGDVTANNNVAALNGNVTAGVDVIAANDVAAGTDVLAGGNVTAGIDVIAGRDITSGRDIRAENDIISTNGRVVAQSGGADRAVLSDTAEGGSLTLIDGANIVDFFGSGQINTTANPLSFRKGGEHIADLDYDPVTGGQAAFYGPAGGYESVRINRDGNGIITLSDGVNAGSGLSIFDSVGTPVTSGYIDTPYLAAKGVNAEEFIGGEAYMEIVDTFLMVVRESTGSYRERVYIDEDGFIMNVPETDQYLGFGYTDNGSGGETAELAFIGDPDPNPLVGAKETTVLGEGYVAFWDKDGNGDLAAVLGHYPTGVGTTARGLALFEKSADNKNTLFVNADTGDYSALGVKDAVSGSEGGGFYLLREDDTDPANPKVLYGITTEGNASQGSTSEVFKTTATFRGAQNILQMVDTQDNGNNIAMFEVNMNREEPGEDTGYIAIRPGIPDSGGVSYNRFAFTFDNKSNTKSLLEVNRETGSHIFTAGYETGTAGFAGLRYYGASGNVGWEVGRTGMTSTASYMKAYYDSGVEAFSMGDGALMKAYATTGQQFFNISSTGDISIYRSGSAMAQLGTTAIDGFLRLGQGTTYGEYRNGEIELYNSGTATFSVSKDGNVFAGGCIMYNGGTLGACK